ncbi:MAG: hypothetical protein R2712_24700 [Vicinamibacterales bacterium]
MGDRPATVVGVLPPRFAFVYPADLYRRSARRRVSPRASSDA